jgi:O-antigen ligase
MNLTQQDIYSFLGATLIGVLPLLMLTEIGHSSGAWYALVGICLIFCLTRDGGYKQTVLLLHPYRWLIAAFLFTLVPAILNMLRFHAMPGAEVERALRMILGCVVVLAAVMTMHPQWVRRITWGFVIAGLVSCVYVFWPSERDFGRPVTPEYNSVTYGNLMLLLGVMIMYSIRWTLTQWPRSEQIFKWVVVAIVLTGFITTQTRTGWLALPFFLLIWLVLNNYVKRPVRLIAALVLLVVVCVSSLMLIPKMNERVHEGYNEISECVTTNPLAFTSVCIRLQLWRTSMDMFYKNPLLGIGRRVDFQPELLARVDQGMLLPFVAEDFAEPHSDMIMILATQGILGGIALFLIYFAPAVIFLRRLRYRQLMCTRVAAAMGLAVCIGFAIFGLTELMFRGMRTIGFYSVMVGCLLALSDPRLKQADRQSA